MHPPPHSPPPAPWARQLREISRALGAALPVYVVITKLDRVPHFAEFVRNLSNEEAQQVLGATLAQNPASAGVYAEKATEEVGGAFDRLCASLAAFRLDLLARESDQKSTPSVYEFPRELRKLRANLTQYLVELVKPSQLSANPYLRGFYFTGIRAQVIEQAVSSAAPAPQVEPQDAGATRMFSLQELRAPARVQQPAVVSRKVPQWTFLPRLFPHVILGDKSALSASQITAPARLFRRILFGAIAAALAIYILLLLISWRNNAALEQRILAAAQALPAASSSPSSALPTTQTQDMPRSLLLLESLDLSGHNLATLDQLRSELEQLEDYQQHGPPLLYRWGLYQGNRLAPSARRIYFDRFRSMLLAPTQANLVAYLAALPESPAPGADYTSAYNPLKAYLITTSNPEKSTPEFLTPVLMQYWLAGRPSDAEQQQLARRQLDFYANELRRANPYSIAPDTTAVAHARAYLAKFGGLERMYQAMLAAAEKSSPAIDFNRQYPRSSEVVVENHLVRGAFTRSGFDFISDALKHPGRYFSGETWVLGEQAAPSLDQARITQQLADEYSANYLKEWRAFLTGATVVGYRNLADAAVKLNIIASPTSPLLALFYVVSHNTAVPDHSIAAVFQPAQVLVAPNSADRYIGPGNTAYVNALLALQGSIAQVAQAPGGITDPAAGLPILTAATAAHIAARQTAQAFTIDPKAHVETVVLNLMEAPIRSAEALVKGIGPAAANGAGRAFCASFDALMAKFPFTSTASTQATLPEVTAVFAPDTGSLWQFYNANLKTMLIPQGQQYVPAPNAPMQVTPAFNRFFNRAAAISTTLFPSGAKSPALTFTLHQVPTKGIQNASLIVDAQRITGANATQQLTWNGATAQQAQLTASYLDAKDLPLLQLQGTWALFELLNKAHAQRTGSGAELEFPLEVSNTPIKLPDGTPLVVRFDLSGPGAAVLTPGALNGLRCVPQVAH